MYHKFLRVVLFMQQSPLSHSLPWNCQNTSIIINISNPASLCSLSNFMS